MSKIVAIHSFRGGTGKSNVTANVASQVALTGKRVGMIDTDIQSPGIHVLFGLDQNNIKHTLNEYLRGEIEIKDAAIDIGAMVGGMPGRDKLAGMQLFLVPSSPDAEEISRVVRDGYDVNKLTAGFKDIRKDLELDWLFIDTHPGINEETLISAVISDWTILILRPDNQDFQGTAVAVDVSHSLDIHNIRLVVNKALLSKYDKEQIRAEVEARYNVPVAALLPLSEDMVDNASSDIFSLNNPSHQWSKGIMDITNFLLEQ